MPNDLTDSNNVAWGEDQLNAITAAAATLSGGGVDAGLKLLNDMVKQGEDFIVNDISDMVTINLVSDIVNHYKVSPERFKLISEKVDMLKRNSYLMLRARKQLDKIEDSIPEGELNELLRKSYKEIFGKDYPAKNLERVKMKLERLKWTKSKLTNKSSNLEQRKG